MSQTTPSPTPRSSFVSALESLIEATNAFKSFRPILLLGITLVGAALTITLFAAVAKSFGSVALGMVGALLGFLVAFYGSNAVGIMMLHQAREQPASSITDAVLLSLYSSHRLIVVVILEGLIVLVAAIAVAALLFVCKMPGVGPALFTLVFPVTAIFVGLLLFALFYIMLPLAGPAVWSGSTVFQVLARLGTLVRTKLASIVLLEILLFFITMFVTGLIFSVVFMGIGMVSTLSASILDTGATGVGNPLQMFAMAGSYGYGYLYAGMIGGGLLFAIAAVIPSLVFTKGICIIYLNSTRDIDFTTSEASLNQGLASIRKKTEEARVRARELAEQHRPDAAAVVITPALATSTSCPNCAAQVAPDDVFCGNCGHKLKPE